MSLRSNERGTKPGTLPVPSAQADEEGSVPQHGGQVVPQHGGQVVPQHGGQADPPSHVDIFRKALMASEQLSRSPSVDTVNAQLDQVTVEDKQQMDIDQVGDSEDWRGLLGRIAPTCEAAIKSKIRNISAAKVTYIIDCVRKKVDYAIAQIESSLLTTKSEADEFLEKLALPLEELKVIIVRESGQAEVLRELTGILQCSEGDLTEVNRGVGPQHASTSHTQAAAGHTSRQFARITKEQRWASTAPEIDLRRAIAKIVDSILPRAQQGTMDFKYPKSAWTDSERRDILVTLLEGQAKMLYRTLPKEVKEGPY
uniref:Gag_p30 domain-containing protein n=1 Tax=Haemonchus contortus TaxID=6289 RepID=A0A7I4YMX4_HAECO